MRQRLIHWTGVLVVVFGGLQPICMSESSDCYTDGIDKGLQRALQFKWERAEKPNLVLVQGPGNTTQLVPNPDRYLNQHSFMFDFSQIYPTLADADLAGLKDDCKKKWKQRGLGGISLSVSLFENPRVVQSTILPASRQVGYKIEFNASKVFKADAKTNAKWDPNKLWGLLPTFSFERKTPFDFLKYGGQLVPATTESGLNSLSFTWDFRGVIRPRQPDSKSTLAAQIKKLCVIRGTATSYVSVPADGSVAMCQELATALGAQEFKLACASERTVTIGDPIPSKRPLGDLKIEEIPDGNACKWNERPQVARLE